MASPTTPVMPPSGVPPKPRPRSFAGPVVLILLGILFLLGTMDVLNWHGLLILFARYWPALLILWGVIKLVEYEQAKRAGQQGRGIGAGGVFIVLFLIFTGLTATQGVRWWPEIRENIQLGDDEDIQNIFCGSSFDYSDDLSHEIPLGGVVHINDEHGTVNINATDTAVLKVSVRKKVCADRQSQADEYNNQTKPSITVNDKIVTLNANALGAGDKSVTTDMDVFLPRNVPIVMTAKRGDVTVTGQNANLEINHQRGEVSVADQTGNVVLSLDRSSARLNHIKGDVTIQGKANEVAVEDVDGAVHLNGEFQESVRLVRVSKTVSFRSSRTDLELARLDGRLDLDSGDLRADSVTGPVRLITRSKDITLDGLSGDLRLEDNNGTVEVGLHKPGNIQIQNRKGDVQVTIPPHTPISIDARAHEGEIESDFDEFKVSNNEREASASGSIGSDGPRVVINNEKGTIGIRKGSVAVAAPPAPPAPPAKAGTKAIPAPKTPPVESEN